jgi:hypothetical protein
MRGPGLGGSASRWGRPASDRRFPVVATADPRSREDGQLPEPQTVPLGEKRDRVEVDLELVAGDDLADRGFVPL